jgi:hypothetical protein
MNKQLLAIEAVVKLFWNYTSEDIDNLKGMSPDFDYMWNTYVLTDTEYETTYPLLWNLWMMKFINDTKQLVTDYALSRYADEVEQGHAQAAAFKRIMRSRRNED